MATKGDIYLGQAGSEVLLSAFGRKLKISDKEISRQGRTASGKLVKEIVSVKKEFTLDYDVIDGTNLETFLDLYDLEAELSLLLYLRDYDAGTTTTPAPGDGCDSYTVLMKPIDRTRLLLLENGIWSGVSIELEEV